jgi:Holliday junction resolvasome RuvABC endonuclease subunit
MIVLALDPGKHTGWAVPDASGTLVLDRAGDQKLPETQRHGVWFCALHERVDSLIDRYRVEAIALERQLVIPGMGSLVTLGIRAIVLRLAWSRNLLVDEIEISAWQKWAKAEIGWAKHEKKHGGDEVDATAIMLFWQRVRLPLVVAV